MDVKHRINITEWMQKCFSCKHCYTNDEEADELLCRLNQCKYEPFRPGDMKAGEKCDMDIKQKINELSEQEAKAALAWCLLNWSRNADCANCRKQMRCVENTRALTGKLCSELVLEKALKEIRE